MSIIGPFWNRENWRKLNEKLEGLQTQINEVGISTTNDETVQARIGADGNVYPRLKVRLDEEHDELNSQLVDKATKKELYAETNAKADRSYVDKKVAETNTRIDDIVTTTPDGVSEQEIIDARDGKASLGANIRDVRSKTVIGLENEVTDGDFSSGGLSHFYTTYGTSSIVNGNVILTGESGRLGATINQTLSNEIPTNQVWYFKTRARATDAGANWLAVGVRATSGTDTGRINDPVADQWYTFSHYISDFTGLSGNLNASVYSYWPDATDKKVEVDYLMAINLTEFFGSGKEPTKEQVDDLFSNSNYFDGDFGAGRIANYLLEVQNQFQEDVNEEVRKAEKFKDSKLENIITNGDFSNGKEGWTSSSGTTSTASDGWLTITGVGDHSSPRVFQKIQTTYAIGDVLYLTADFVPKNEEVEQVGFAVYSDLSTEDDISYLSSSNLAVDESTNVSGNVVVPSATGDMRVQVRSRYATAEASNGNSVNVTGIKVYNLTNFFGKGNEPSSESFEKMLNVMPSHNDQKYTDISETQKAVVEHILDRSQGQSGSVVRPLFAITFDDGTLSDYEMAFPFLRLRGIPATAYVTTAWRTGEDFMTWEQLKELKDHGWGIEGHTNVHPNLTTLTDEEIRTEMENTNQKFIEAGFPTPRHMALPHGAGWNNERVLDVVSEYRKTIRNIGAFSPVPYQKWDNIDYRSLNSIAGDIRDDNIELLQKAKDSIDQAYAQNGIAILYGHALKNENPQTSEGLFEYWAEVVDYARAKDFEFVTIDDIYLETKNYKRATNQI